MGRAYGWKRPSPEHRVLAAAHHFSGGLGLTPQQRGFIVKPKVDTRALYGDALDQGEVGDCTANGGEEVHEGARAAYNLPKVLGSRYFLYAVTREDMGVALTEDTGATITDMMLALMRHGICSEATWPSTDPKGWKVAPSQAARDEAARHKALRCYSLSDVTWMKACLSLGFPVVFGFSVPESFETLGADGQLRMPGAKERFVGGHCVVAVGYDDEHDNGDGTKGAFLCRNSWGKGWGMDGHFWMPEAYFASLLATDMWCCHQEAA